MARPLNLQWADAVAETRLPAATKQVAERIACAYMDTRSLGRVRVSIDRLALDCSRDDRTVRKAIQQLVAIGALVHEGGGKGTDPNHYHAEMPPWNLSLVRPSLRSASGQAGAAKATDFGESLAEIAERLRGEGRTM